MTEVESSPLLYLWQHRTLFIGKLKTALDISTGAATFMVALDKPLKFMTAEMEQAIECHSLLLPAGIPVIIDTRGSNIANCTLDPFGQDLNLLSNLMANTTGQAFYDSYHNGFFINTFRKIQKSPESSRDSLRTLSNLINIDQSFGYFNRHTIDSRISFVTNIIQETINENLSLEELARQVNLSQSRLVELFKRQTGLPIRRYRLWYRLYKTTELVGEGKSLTEAAIDAGFTDSSHFNRTFRSMLGMTPTEIFKQAKEMKVILPSKTTYSPTLISLGEVLLENLKKEKAPVEVVK